MFINSLSLLSIVSLMWATASAMEVDDTSDSWELVPFVAKTHLDLDIQIVDIRSSVNDSNPSELNPLEESVNYAVSMSDQLLEIFLKVKEESLECFRNILIKHLDIYLMKEKSSEFPEGSIKEECNYYHLSKTLYSAYCDYKAKQRALDHEGKKRVHGMIDYDLNSYSIKECEPDNTEYISISKNNYHLSDQVREILNNYCLIFINKMRNDLSPILAQAVIKLFSEASKEIKSFEFVPDESLILSDIISIHESTVEIEPYKWFSEAMADAIRIMDEFKPSKFKLFGMGNNEENFPVDLKNSMFFKMHNLSNSIKNSIPLTIEKLFSVRLFITMFKKCDVERTVITKAINAYIRDSKRSRKTAEKYQRELSCEKELRAIERHQLAEELERLRSRYDANLDLLDERNRDVARLLEELEIQKKCSEDQRNAFTQILNKGKEQVDSFIDYGVDRYNQALGKQKAEYEAEKQKLKEEKVVIEEALKREIELHEKTDLELKETQLRMIEIQKELEFKEKDLKRKKQLLKNKIEKEKLPSPPTSKGTDESMETELSPLSKLRDYQLPLQTLLIMHFNVKPDEIVDLDCLSLLEKLKSLSSQFGKELS